MKRFRKAAPDGQRTFVSGTQRSIGMQRYMEQWVSMLWSAMHASGNGYMRHSLRNTGRGSDRRADKRYDSTPSSFRRYRNRYSVLPAK